MNAAVALLALVPTSAPSEYRLDKVANLKTVKEIFTFSPAHRDALRRNGFFVSPSTDEALYWVYGQNDYREIPSFVTVDNMLQTYHIFFDSALRRVEEKRLLPDVGRLTRGMLAKSLARYAKVKRSPLEPVALRNAAYFAVADRLSGHSTPLPASVQKVVEAELAKIEAHRDFAACGVVDGDVDYSQFGVRGHYTRSPELGTYFQTMMWYGLVPFGTELLKGGKIYPAITNIQQSVLISQDLLGAEKTLWAKIYDVTSLFAGSANDLTPREWSAIATRVFPTGNVLDKQACLAFVDAVKRARAPMIVSKRQRGTVALAGQFRFMGQRAIPDSVIFNQLTDAEKRPFPSPLDVMSVLGSRRATSILDSAPQRYNPKGWSAYRPTRAKLTTDFARLSPAARGEDLYRSWFDTLRLQVSPVPARAPKFMQSAAWADRAMYTALASWAELRHDTILYGEQTVAEMGDGEEPELVKGYVEPRPEVFARLNAMVRQTARGLKSRGYLEPAIADQFNDFTKVTAFLQSVAERELAGKKLSRAEHNRIRFIEGELESLHNTIQRILIDYRMMSDDDLNIALVADVHTANGQALTVGVGHADELYAIVPIEGKTYLARGSTLSYYEFLQPISNRLTDEAWKQQLAAGKIPARPTWTKSFYVPGKVKALD